MIRNKLSIFKIAGKTFLIELLKLLLFATMSALCERWERGVWTCRGTLTFQIARTGMVWKNLRLIVFSRTGLTCLTARNSAHYRGKNGKKSQKGEKTLSVPLQRRRASCTFRVISWVTIRRVWKLFHDLNYWSSSSKGTSSSSFIAGTVKVSFSRLMTAWTASSRIIVPW